MTDYWKRQTNKEPLFTDILWSRPENKRTAGKLLIIGGSLHGFAAPAEAYNESINAGTGSSKVLLPDSVQKLVGGVMENGEFAPSTKPSGGFSKKALIELLEYSNWADGVLIAGDLGRNSETVVLLEQFADKYSGQLTLTKDAADNLIKSADLVIDRPQTTWVISLAQLQKLAISAKFSRAFTFDMDLVRLVDSLHEFSVQNKINIITKQFDQLIVACNGHISTTRLMNKMPIWRIKTASAASVWWLQNPNKTFEALTTAIYEVAK